jgi:hypothetical protein
MKKVLFAALTIMVISSCSKKDESTPAVVYTKVSVTKMTINNFPAGDASGYNWDNSLNGTYPDVYFKITNSGTTTALFSLATSSRIENLQVANLPKSWANTSGAPFFVLSDLTQAVDVDLYDYDYATTDQYMGSTTFNFSNYTTGSTKYPTTVTTTNGSVSVTLDLIWLQ